MAFAATLLLSSLPALAAPPRIDTLAVTRSEEGSARGCTPDQLCVDTTPPQAGCEGPACSTDVSLQLPGGRGDPVHTAFRITGLPSADVSAEPWPLLIRFNGGILAGV